jgi:hypothetical protein
MTHRLILVAAALAVTAAALALYRGRHRGAILAGARGGRLPELSPRGFALVAAAVLLAHAALVFVFLPPRVAFSPEPILETDYAHHYHAVAAVVATMEREGRAWAYDPSFCAGYPEGTLFDVDLKLVELAVFALSRIGVGVGRAFNLVVLASFLAAPVLLLGACRNFGWPRTPAILVLASGVLLWHGSPMIVAFDAQGMFAFVLATYWALYAVSSLDRYLRAPGWASYAALVAAVAIGLHVHILMPFLLLGPVLAIYLPALRAIPIRRHALLLLAAALAALANAWWIRTVIRFYPFRLITTLHEPPSWRGLAAFTTQLTSPPIVAGLLGALGFVIVRAERRAVAVMGLASLAWFFFLSDLSSGLPLLSTLEPERFRIPLAVFGLVGAALGASTVLADPARYRLPSRVAVLVAAGVLYQRGLRPYAPHLTRFRATEADFAPLVSWLDQHTTKDARVALMDTTPGFLAPARLLHYVDRAFIGGPFTQFDMAHNYANITQYRFFTQKMSEVTKEDVARYADVYNIGWIVTTTAPTCEKFASFTPVLEKVAAFDIEERAPDVRARIFDREAVHPVCAFEVKRAPGWFLEGSGELEAGLDRIVVRGASPGRVALKFHWLGTFAVDPPLPLVRRKVERSSVGFIEVDNGATTDFVIRNTGRAP